jgi:hypothetical protein
MTSKFCCSLQLLILDIMRAPNFGRCFSLPSNAIVRGEYMFLELLIDHPNDLVEG